MTAGLAAVFLPGRVRAQTEEIWLLSPATIGEGHFVVQANDERQLIRSSALPFRGHGLLPDPSNANRALLISRRPGTEAVQMDLSTGKILHRWQAEEDRHF